MKKCPFCAEEIQNEAVKCRHCGSMLPVPVPSLKETFNQPVAAPQIIAVVVVLLLAGYFVWTTIISGESGFSPAAANNHDVAAYVMCENLVRAKLKAPSTAEFVSAINRASHLGDDVYSVTSQVDAENGFGAKMRATWSCRIKYKGGNEAADANWEALDVSITSP